MKKRLMVILAFAFCMTVFGAAGLMAAEILKVGIFDMQKVMRESKSIEGQRQRLATQLDAKRKPLLEKEAYAKGLEEKLKNDRNLSPVERKSTEEKLSNEARDMRRIKEDLDAEFQKIDREATQQTMRDIAEVVKMIAAKDDYTLILEKSAGGVVFSKDTIDITQRVLTDYDGGKK